MVLLGEEFPNFCADSTAGEINFHEWLNNSWAIFFSHPADFTPVCTTELAEVVKLMPEFEKRSLKVVALSCDTVESHKKWSKDILHVANKSIDFPFPIIADRDRDIILKLGMIDLDEKDSSNVPLPARAVFIIDPKNKMRLSILYPATTGRNFHEILRVIDSLQLTDKHKCATPVNWQKGEPVMILPTLGNEEIEATFPKGYKQKTVPSKLNYLRETPQP